MNKVIGWFRKGEIMRRSKFLLALILIIMGCFPVHSDTIELHDGSVIDEIMIGDISNDYVTVVIPMKSVKSVAFVQSSSPEAEAALKAYEKSIIRTYTSENAIPFKDQSVQIPHPESSSNFQQSSVSGRILFHQEPADEMDVGLRRIHVGFSWGGLVKAPENAATQNLWETTTDSEGYYEFTGIPIGNYDLLWKPKGSETWVKRLSERPDVVIKSIEHIELKDIESAKKTVN